MSVYKLHASTVGDSVATLDIQNNGRIQGIKWCCTQLNIANLAGFKTEVSFGSTNGFTSNDTKASIDGCRMCSNLLTTGAMNNAIGEFTPMDTPVQAGERLHLHIGNIGSPDNAPDVTAYIYVKDSGRATFSRRP